jgi:hypothetical protein
MFAALAIPPNRHRRLSMCDGLETVEDLLKDVLEIGAQLERLGLAAAGSPRIYMMAGGMKLLVARAKLLSVPFGVMAFGRRCPPEQ